MLATGQAGVHVAIEVHVRALVRCDVDGEGVLRGAMVGTVRTDVLAVLLVRAGHVRLPWIVLREPFRSRVLVEPGDAGGGNLVDECAAPGRVPDTGLLAADPRELVVVEIRVEPVEDLL